jgi:F1F0 ATPase subunit 2
MLVRLEVDEDRMNFLPFEDLPSWGVLLSLAAHLAGGIVLGVLYFRGLWWSACRFNGRGSTTTAIALMVGRFALLGGLLTLASLQGALPLLMMALGVLIARPVVMCKVREAAP